jgi:hypothetical protein
MLPGDLARRLRVTQGHDRERNRKLVPFASRYHRGPRLLVPEYHRDLPHHPHAGRSRPSPSHRSEAEQAGEIGLRDVENVRERDAGKPPEI